MSELKQIEQLVERLSDDDRQALLRRFLPPAGGTARGIQHTPEVCGGAARIKGTRIPVWLLESLRRMGATEASLLENYPTLRAEDLVNAWKYAESHRDEIDRDIAENDADE